MKPGRPWAVYLLSAYVAALPFWSVAPAFALRQIVIPADLVFVLVPLPAIVSLYRERRLRPGPFELLLAGYLASVALAAVFSADPATSARSVLKVAYLLAVGFFTRKLLSDEGRRETAISFWLAGAAVTAAASLTGVALFYAGMRELGSNPFLRIYGSLPPGDYPRIAAFFLNVNMLCSYLLASTALAWYRWRTRPGRRRYPVLLAALCGAALFTFSTGLGGLVLMLALLWVALPPAGGELGTAGRRAVLTLGLAIAAVVLAAAAIAPPEPGGALEPSVRWLTWRGAWETFARAPLLGHGPGLPVADVPFSVPSGRVIRFTDGHHVWLNVAAQAGLVGVLSLAALVGWVVGSALRRLREGPRGRSWELTGALAIAVAGTWLYHGLTGSWEDARHLWVLLGLTAAAAEAPTAHPRHP